MNPVENVNLTSVISESAANLQNGNPREMSIEDLQVQPVHPSSYPTSQHPPGLLGQ